MREAHSGEFRRHWPLVAGSSLGLGFGVSMWATIASLFVLPLSAEFGWTRGEIAQLSAISLITALWSPLVGLAADRWGVRPVAILSYVLLGGGYLVATQLTGSLWSYALLLLAMGFCGIGTTAITWARPIVGTFFVARGLALALVFAGVSISGILVPPLLEAVIAAQGWRSGFVTVAALVWGVGLVAALVIMPRKPITPMARAALARAPRQWGVIFRSPAFWLLFAAMVLVNLGGTGLIGQLVPMLSDRGLRSADAALLLSLYAAAILVGRLTTGLLLDRVNPPLVSALAMLVPALGCLMLNEAALGLAYAALAVVLIGAAQGAETDVLGFMTARYLGQAHYSALMGIYFGATLTGNSLGAVLIGRTYDATGHYTLALWIFAAAFALGAMAFGALRWCRVVEHRGLPV
ncbi:MFS transporter [Sandaracinobacteroides saxicola]|uniref:MFS transporter n=1 Tax=Sandaracinobacteroides saxicola TaxID=2759707 RepID=A0A7G5IDR8_9SPHN|nr:MFS transporter [Sandaracinobacteroides saxicola]QMW21510.1 MFS transporter [Sandaracinobacteroides saxicola]